MVSFRINLADTVIQVHAVHESTACFCRDYVTDSIPNITVTVLPEDIARERDRSRCEREYEGLAPRDFSSEYLETLALYRKIAEGLIAQDVVLFHGSALMMDGKAYIFTAKSGTGKSTHSSIWRRVFGDRVTMINDDKPLLRIREGGVTVYGTPWSGKHSLGSNISAPVSAICSIYRAATNIAAPVSPKEAFPIILGQTYRPSDALRLRATLSLAERIATTVPCYSLGCNMEDEAALVSYSAMKGDTP